MNQLGLIGLGTMGANLARNAARNGATVVLYNRTTEKTDGFMENFAAEGDFRATKSYEEFVSSLEAPRAIVLMVKAGDAVDAVIEDLLPHLEAGDIIIDAGNSHYPDSDRRTKELGEKNIHFVGMGVSGGEEGALNGPSMMPGGDKATVEKLLPLLEKMAADDGKSGKCVSYVGPGGAGHFVKMVHNGIEYGIMQLIAESCAVLKDAGYTNEEIAETFDIWKEGDDLKSFLVEITADIFKKKDDLADGDLIDVIGDRAGQKGTGKWTTIAALHAGVAIPTINVAVDARIISGSTEKREKAQKTFPVAIDEQEPVPKKEKLRSMLRTALGLSTLCAYNQGFDLVGQVSDDEGWSIDLPEMARIWRGGCIIRSVLLDKFERELSLDASISKKANEEILDWFKDERQEDWRRIIELAVARGIPVPALSASLHYFDALRTEKLPQSVVQAQRDYFGAHTYERNDREGSFHTEW